MTEGIPLSQERLRALIFNVLHPIWPDGLRVYVASEDHIAATFADQLLQASYGGPNAAEQLTLMDRSQSLQILQAGLAGHPDSGELKAALQSMLRDGTLQCYLSGSGLLDRDRQRLTGYVVRLNLYT